jgi:ATP-dependent Clp protease ATP-binding subunit ClpA
MQLNPEIESILTQATRLAHTNKHAYVTVEHLCLALLRHPPFWACVDKYGVSPDGLDQDLEVYLETLVALKSDNGTKVEPKKTNALERCLIVH